VCHHVLSPDSLETRPAGNGLFCSWVSGPARGAPTPRGVADEEDVALSAFNSFCLGAEQGHFAQLFDRDNLWRGLVTITARKAYQQAAAPRLRYEIDRRQIKAPVRGRVGQVGGLREGSVVRATERLAAIVPNDVGHRAVAFFPAAVVGRIKTGKQARLRLAGYPWAQYGTVRAEVREVGNEASDGLVRVELALTADPPPNIPIEHGMPGKAEVEVERISPAELVLRAAEQLLTPKRDTPSRGSPANASHAAE
jgi:hypothetical protein